MRKIVILGAFLIPFISVRAQRSKPIKSGKINPRTINMALDFSISKPLRDLPPSQGPRTEKEQKAFKELKEQKESLNFSMKYRKHPNASVAKPLHGDPVKQSKHGWNRAHNESTPVLNFEGQSCPYAVLDCNGAVGPNHFMQAINTTYAIWDKQGNQVIAQTNFNTLFEGVTGANRNDGDPIVIYDEQADRWLTSEFSLGSNNYMLIAISVTNDPTGEWYRWSFDVDDMPDYMKFGVWRDGYYMGVNNSTANKNDIYVFNREAMLAGASNPQMIGFDNPNRPNSGFHCVEPLDNDGAFAPEGTPGQFITINDDAWDGSSDQIWIFELDVDWENPNNSTFERVQQIDVEPFDSNFGTDWANIVQPGTSQKVDAVPQILMYRTQYRNFDGEQVIVCAHTVDVDDTDHAGIRWYELQNTGTGSGWSIRQQGTYAPDENSRWIPAICMDGNRNIALGYNIASDVLYPGIRYCGQSAAENAIASNIMDIAEETVLLGTKSYTESYRWADYAGMCVDPVDDATFWFTTEYAKGSHSKSTQIVSFKFAENNNLNNDVGVFSLNMQSSSEFTENENIEVLLMNYGLNPISNFPISFQVNGGEIITETITEIINPNAFYTYTFNGTADLSNEGEYEIKIYTHLLNDENTGNDTISKDLVHLEASYCSASGGNGYEFIRKVVFVDISNTSPESNYSDFTNIITDIERGSTYEFTMSINGGYASDEGIVWIDWNQDFIFDDNNEKYNIGTGSVASYSANISVPEDALLGETKMRVRLHDAGSTSTPNETSCGSSSYGEVEDYTVNIIEPTSTNLISVDKGITVQPNPANNKIQITVKKGAKPLEIRDASGRSIYKFGNSSNSSTLVETSTWAEGVYFMQYQTKSNQNKVFEIVIKH